MKAEVQMQIVATCVISHLYLYLYHLNLDHFHPYHLYLYHLYLHIRTCKNILSVTFYATVQLKHSHWMF